MHYYLSIAMQVKKNQPGQSGVLCDRNHGLFSSRFAGYSSGHSFLVLLGSYARLLPVHVEPEVHESCSMAGRGGQFRAQFRRFMAPVPEFPILLANWTAILSLGKISQVFSLNLKQTVFLLPRSRKGTVNDEPIDC